MTWRQAVANLLLMSLAWKTGRHCPKSTMTQWHKLKKDQCKFSGKDDFWMNIDVCRILYPESFPRSYRNNLFTWAPNIVPEAPICVIICRIHAKPFRTRNIWMQHKSTFETPSPPNATAIAAYQGPRSSHPVRQTNVFSVSQNDIILNKLISYSLI